MSELSVLASIVGKVAPILGTALLGPAGGVIVSLIGQALGLSSKSIGDVTNALQSDPSANAKLAALEYEHSEALTALENQDRANARQREIEVGKEPVALRDKVPARIAFVFIAGYFIVQLLVIGLVYADVVTTAEIAPILQMQKDMGMAIMLILAYYYAASHRS